ncbi:hypothetical protein [Georhizobium sp. MAB10]|uniref:hypothetical protein n=1 Tax=Georhizobium sp. MAB10 TaxID=3028319 RepID=UPI003855A285
MHGSRPHHLHGHHHHHHHHHGHDDHGHRIHDDHGHHHEATGPALGHNHSHADHLHSHPHGSSRVRQDLQELAASFVEGFRAAGDKTSYLRLAGIPFQMPDSGGKAMHLVDTRIETNWQIGTATPGFGTSELAYLPFPGKMVTEREVMMFTYVSMKERRDIDLCTLLADRFRDQEH